MDATKYRWTPRHVLPIEDFVKKYRPSVTESGDTDWISVLTETAGESEVENNAQTKAIGKGQGDASIPVRAKKGVKSKKALRDEIIAETAEMLKRLSLDSGFTDGKWMFFPKNEHVDGIWARIARSVAGGPLKDAGVKAAKVAPAQPGGEEYATQLICIHIDDIYDVEQVRKILTVLLTEHGIEPSAAKSDLYTSLDIDSKHPSKMRSSLWRPSEVIEGGDSAVKAQYKPEKDRPEAYKPSAKPKNENEAGSAGANPAEQTQSAEGLATGAGVKRGAPGERKGAEHTEQSKPTQQDLLVNPEKAQSKEPKRPAKRIKSAARRFKEEDVFAGSDDEF